jgi:hypothetical protein
MGPSAAETTRIAPSTCDVGDRNRDAALALLRSLVDLVERRELGHPLLSLPLGDGGRERGLAVVDVTHRPDVHVRLRALELLLAHDLLSSFWPTRPRPGR